VAEWTQGDEWYWKTDGWTICKVWINDGYQFEIWKQGADGAVDRKPTLKEAQARQAELAT
jgi:hypothetical protein